MHLHPSMHQVPLCVFPAHRTSSDGVNLLACRDMPEDLLHHWMFDEPEKHKAELDALTDAGAFIMGSKMFGPKDRRDTTDWKGWWGDDPPYHAAVFVLSKNKRDPIDMEGGTKFIFVTDGIESALSQAKKVAGNRNVSIA